MKPINYACLDIETTCLHPRKPENLLMLSIVMETVGGDRDTTKLPVWQVPHMTVLIGGKEFTGEPYALQLNAWIFRQICDAQAGRPTQYPVVSLEAATEYAIDFIKTMSPGVKPYPVGQNIGAFDLAFLPKSLTDEMHFRAVEIGSVFFDPTRGPRSLPQVKESLGFSRDVSHNAWHEAMDYVLTLRTKHGGDLTPYNKSL